MRIDKIQGRYILLILLVLISISTYIQMGIYEKFLPQFSDFIQEYLISILLVSVVIQLFILLIVLGIETFSLFLAVTLFLKRDSYLGQYVNVVLLSMVLVYVINIFISLYYLPLVDDVETVYRIVIASPVNYLLKPLVVLFLLYQQGLIFKRPLEWLTVGGVYLAVTYLPGVLLLSFFRIVG
jgi:hypothetical protein